MTLENLGIHLVCNLISPLESSSSCNFSPTEEFRLRRCFHTLDVLQHGKFILVTLFCGSAYFLSLKWGLELNRDYRDQQWPAFTRLSYKWQISDMWMKQKSSTAQICGLSWEQVEDGFEDGFVDGVVDGVVPDRRCHEKGTKFENSRRPPVLSLLNLLQEVRTCILKV